MLMITLRSALYHEDDDIDDDGNNDVRGSNIGYGDDYDDRAAREGGDYDRYDEKYNNDRDEAATIDHTLPEVYMENTLSSHEGEEDEGGGGTTSGTQR